MTSINFRDKVLQVEGNTPQVGSEAPRFSLQDIEGKTFNNETILGKKTIISVFPDINTSVCDLQTRHAYKLFKDRDDVNILNVSNNSAEDLKKWCLLKDIDMTMLVDPDKTFALAYGIWLPEIKKLARSIFVIDEKGTLVYYELVAQLTHEPDFEKVLTYL